MKYKDTFTSLIAIGLLVVVIGIYIWWQQQLFTERKASLQLELDIQNVLLLENKILHLQDKTSQLENDEAQVVSHFVKEDDIVLFLRHIEFVGNTHNVEVEVTSVSDTADSGLITLTLSAKGSFSNVMKTLGAYEHDAYTIIAKDISLTTHVPEEWEMTGTFTVLTFVL